MGAASSSCSSVHLAINTVLPLLGVARPLATVPVLLLVDVIDAGLWLFRRRRPALFGMRRAGPPGCPRDPRALALGGACVLLMVLGANRLNNGNGYVLTMIGLGVALLTLALLLLWACGSGPASRAVPSTCSRPPCS